MKEYIKIIIKIFIKEDFIEEDFIEEDFIEEDFIEENKKETNNTIKWSNIGYIIGTLSIIGIGIYLYSQNWFDNPGTGNINNIGHTRQLDEIGEITYKLSTKISKSCTVQSWEIIHKILKELNTETLNKQKIIQELKELIVLNIKYPGQFSQNSEYFEKSLIKFINFLNSIL